MPMANALHDEIDAQEELRERARAVIDEVKPLLSRAVEQTGDTESAMALLAEAVGEKLAALTTEAVRTGATMARRRAAVAGNG